MRIAAIAGALLAFTLLCADSGAQKVETYVKKSNRVDTILATLAASGYPTLEGRWHIIGSFDNSDGQGLETVYPPEKEIDLAKSYVGKGGKAAKWKELQDFHPGKMFDIQNHLGRGENSCCYLLHDVTAKTAVKLPVSLGSDDGLAVFVNGKRILSQNVVRPAQPDQEEALLDLKLGKNQILFKISNGGGEWSFYICPEFPDTLEAKYPRRLVRDFPAGIRGSNTLLAGEARHYRIATIPIPEGIVLEVGGLAMRQDGSLLACTRRGEIWRIEHLDSEDLSDVKFHLFASGLHEPLGMRFVGKDLYVVQRPELTRIAAAMNIEKADRFITICDRWGVSGDYHEFAFGPAVDKAGNFYVTLNVGFGGGLQSKAPWRGWCVKVTSDGELKPFATGLRSPNGVNISPEGALFYCDNQGEWVATNKMHEIREGEYYGHEAGLRWTSQSSFAANFLERRLSGMLYDGQPGQNGIRGKPPLTPPCIWFPYGRMGQSASEPIWDTTDGKFGPFQGQCFVGDQTKANIMRVALEKVNGRYQGACFPFRSGFVCGINRLEFSADGRLYAGMTNRGWGSVGGKPYGLQRLDYTGVLPAEIQTMHLTRSGFDLRFTKPLDPVSADRVSAYSLQSFTYNYWSTYGSPEVDQKTEPIQSVSLSPDRRTASLKLGGLRTGRVYELHLEGIKTQDGDAILHPEAYYTLNELLDSGAAKRD